MQPDEVALAEFLLEQPDDVALAMFFCGEVCLETSRHFCRGVVSKIGFDTYIDDLSNADSKGFFHHCLLCLGKAGPGFKQIRLRPRGSVPATS